MKALAIAGVKLIAEGDRIVASIREGKPFEPESLAKWAELCAGGGTVLDIGAYTGVYAIVAAKLGCHVIAFEPLHANRMRFRANAALNRVDLKVNSEAISDRVGETTITVNPNVSGLTSGASLVRKNGQQFKIATLTVDSLLLTQCTAIKIDVERAEPLVLAGARETLKRCRPALLVEVLDEERAAGVKAALKGLGYRRKAVLDTRNWLMEAK